MADNVQMQGLEFQVTGSVAKKTAESLKSVTSLLENLKSATNGNFSGLKKVADSMKEIAASASGVAKFAKGMDGISGNAGKIGSVANSLRKISQMSFSNVTELSESMRGLAQASKNITSGGTKRASGDATPPQAKFSDTETVESVSAVGEAFSDAEEQAKEFYQKITSDMLLAKKPVELLAEKIEILKKELQENLGSSDFGEKQAVTAAQQIQRYEEQLRNLEEAETLHGVNSAIEEARKANNALQKELKQGFYESASKADLLKDKIEQIKAAMNAEWGKDITDFGKMNSLAKQLQGAQEQLRNLEGTENPASVFERISSSVKETAKSIGGDFVNAVKRAANGVVKLGKNLLLLPLKQFVNRIGNAVKAVDNLVSSFGRILLYRAVRTLIKDISAAFQEGTSNIYKYSELVGTNLHNALDSIATDIQYIKNLLASVAAPIIETVAPAIDWLTEKFAVLANQAAQFFAALTGKSAYSKALKVPAKYIEETGDASKAATKSVKEFKKQLMGFDEINRLEEPSSTDTGSVKDAAEEAQKYVEMFAETPVDTTISDFAKQVKDAFKAGDWDALGGMFADKVNAIFDGVKWDETGKKLGYGLNGIIKTVYSFLDGIDFLQIGADLATALNNMLPEVDFETWGRLVVKKFTAALDLIVGFITNLDSAQLAQKIGDFILGVLNEFLEAIQRTPWGEIGDKIGEFLKNIPWGEILKTVAQIIWEAIKAALEFLGGFISENGPGIVLAAIGLLLAKVMKDAIGLIAPVVFEIGKKAIIDVLSEEVLPGILSNIASWGPKIAAVMKDAVGAGFLGAGVIAAITAFVDMMKNGMSAASEAIMLVGITAAAVGAIILGAPALVAGVVAAIVAVVATLVIAIHDHWEDIKKWTKDTCEKIKKFFSDSIEHIKAAFKKLGDYIKAIVLLIVDHIKGRINLVLQLVENAVNGIINKINRVLDVINKVGTKVKQFFGSEGELNLHINTVSIPKLASGGFVDEGQLFIANERGPELLGTMNGQTAVANRQEITEGIKYATKEGNEDVVNQLIAMTSQLIQAIRESGRENSVDLYRLTRDVTRTQYNMARARG